MNNPADSGEAKLQLDPTATLQEMMAFADVKMRAAAGAAAMVEDYLKNRVLVLATHNTQLMQANTTLTAQLVDAETGRDD